MAPVRDPEDLFTKAIKVRESGGTGMLISGGCDLNGTVPLRPLADAIKKAAEAGLEINVHPGLVNAGEAERLVNAGISAFSVDIHQDPSVIRNVLHLDLGPEAYGETIDNIVSAGGRVVPHLTVGFGTADLLLSAELLKGRNIMNVTLLALVPAEGTEIHCGVPRESVVGAVTLLRGMGFEVTLGCMRGRDHILEEECIRAGVRKIANPSVRTVRWAEQNGFTVKEIKKCCSL